MQHDYALANAAGAAIRADLNAALEAIVSQNSGATAPTTTFAYQFWADTTTGWLRQRNAGNSAWISVLPLAGAARVDIASASTLDLDAVTSDYVRITGTTGISAVTLAAGSRRLALAGAAFTLTHGASLVLPGAANYTAAAGDLLRFVGESAGVVRVEITKADGSPVVVRSAGSVGVGGAAPAAGAGVSFPATQSPSSDPNTLDDYEEGTFTPTVYGDGTAGTTTYSVQVGRYTRVGRLVHFALEVIWTGQTGSGNLLVGGLPFARVNDGSTAAVSVVLSNVSYTAGSAIAGQIPGNGSVARPVQMSNGAGAALIPVDTSGTLQMSGIYEAA